MTPRRLHVDELADRVGEDLGPSAWHAVTQAEIDRFADATHDHQWIHVDPERAADESPFGTTIAHGYYSIALIPHLLTQIVEVTDAKMVVNRGLEKLRFGRPVRSGRKVRLHATIAEAKPNRHGVEVTVGLSLEVEGERRPAWTAEAIYRYFR